ncbi:glycosyltransferase [Pseudokineococcus sp. 1T1Z-3]|uniref:glycosyltransferase n=1 Tax=Pseudokineococcus sp. 1T1Z-3 TaxID=3132745 RepID=UPI0030A786F1
MVDLRTIAQRTVRNSKAARPLVKAAGRGTSAIDVLRSGLFDQDWYEEQLGRSMSSPLAAAAHYVARGRFAGLSPHPLFEPEWYVGAVWRKADRDPLATYLRYGSREEVSPHPLFDPAVWLSENPGAISWQGGALGHFVAHATSETLLPLPPSLVQVRSAAGLGPLTYGDLRSHLSTSVAERRRGDKLRTAQRINDRHDWEADRAYVAAAARQDLGREVDGGPLVSVVMPVYNRATTVVAAIASLQAQTLEAWELLVLDDGSTDGTGAVLAELAASDSRIVILPGAHEGISIARNAAAAHASGRYLAFLDSDNIWRQDFLQTAVAGLQTVGGRVGYATSELRTAAGSRFRDLDAQVDHLAVRNHVDLNVLILERALFEAVGGFDENLRRTVDYDLVWRVGKLAHLHHLPFVGVVYDDDEAADRVTVRELYSWKDVVRGKHLVDWDREGSRGRTEGLTSAIVVAREDWSPAVRSARGVLGEGGAGEAVIVEWSSRPSVGRILDVIALGDPRILIEHAPDDVRTALGIDLGLARTSGDVLFLLAPGAVVSPQDARELRARLERDAAVAVQPLVLDETDVITSAGWTFPERGTLPSPFLWEHPREDARRLGDVVEVPALDGSALMVRAEAVVSVRGADPLFADDLWDVDLSLRLSNRGALLLVPGTQVSVPRGHLSRSPALVRSSRTAFLMRWAGNEPLDGRPLWRAAGFDVSHYAPRRLKGVPLHLRVPVPVVVRRPGDVRVVHEAPEKLRWAIRTATPPGVEGLHWGDLHFAEALQAALLQLGQDVVLDGRASLWRASTPLDDVTLSIRGKLPLPPQPGAINLLWVISHPQRVTEQDLAGVDAAFAASIPWARWASAWSGRVVTPLLQATDPARFTPSAAPADTGEKVLFVGNSRGVYRPVVRHLVEAGVPMSVYGGGWEGILGEEVLKGTRVDNADLPAKYRAAGILLNDHWEDMRQLGFASNRLFDAAAVGARIVSDAVEGVDDIFGGLVRSYSGPHELVDLVRQGADGFPDEATRLGIAARVAREHSFEARARVLLDAALVARRRRG